MSYENVAVTAFREKNALSAVRQTASPVRRVRNILRMLVLMTALVLCAGLLSPAQAAVKIKGIDVSHYQGKIDWAKVKEDGIEFAMVGLGAYHSTYVYKDPYFDYNMKEADAAGIKVGVYLYSYASTQAQAKKEARWVLECIDGYTVSYPVAFDMEEPSIASLSKTKKTKIAKAFLQIIKKAGYYPMLYASDTWFSQSLNLSSLSGYDFWVARWESKKNKVATKPLSMWQYSAKGKVDGISGTVDLSYSYKDYGKLITPRTHALPGSMEEDEYTGWREVDGKYYYYEKGTLKKGWFRVDGKRYYARPKTGERVTGWLTIKGRKYYLTQEGPVAQGFVKIDGAVYYFSKAGKMQTGWLSLGGRKYYLRPETGQRVRGYLHLKGKTYYFSWKDGSMATGWTKIKGKWHYFSKTGVMKKNTTFKGHKFDQNGVCTDYSGK